MAQNFLTCDRDQPLLLPPDLRDWLPADHLAWFAIEAISELELEPFYAAYRSDGHGAAAHEPKMMVGLLAYSYAVGERSSRGIERRCREDVAVRVICANQIPDHATIARFRVRHEAALADLFGQVLGLCASAGIVEVAVLAVDGSKLEAAASTPRQPKLRADRRRDPRRGGADRRRRGRASRLRARRRAPRAVGNPRRPPRLASRGQGTARARAGRNAGAGAKAAAEAA
jgi:transposase